MAIISRKPTAWIALAAMLFGAVSPALAAALFPHRPDILARMLAIPAAATQGVPQEAAAGEDDGCPHESAADAAHGQSHTAHHGSPGPESPDDSEHAAHGIFCSFCLTANSVVTLLSAAPAPLAIEFASADVAGAPEQQLAQAAPALHRARGPPALPR
jgi:hypothetical protein